MEKIDQDRRQGFRAVIEELLEDKLKPLRKKPPEECETFVKNWLAENASKAKKVQIATHVIKGTNPNARGTDLYRDPKSLPYKSYISTCSLPDGFIVDAAFNSAEYLPIGKFLCEEFQGKILLAWLQENDPDLLAAMHPDRPTAETWARQFTSLRPASTPASHTLAKQVYWLTGLDPTADGEFHLLSPLYASSLAYSLFQIINKDRFGDEAKAARQARRDGKPHAGELREYPNREYPNLGVQKLGGSKPWNVSLLNAKRSGRNYLLASLPPVWKSQETRPPYGNLSFFERFLRRRDTAEIVNRLKRFLESDPKKNKETRDIRDDLLDQIINELFLYILALRALPPGWSADPHCNLSKAEKYWLDPAAREAMWATPDSIPQDWRSEIYRRFANCMNAALGERLPMGDEEHAFWVRALKDSRILEVDYV